MSLPRFPFPAAGAYVGASFPAGVAPAVNEPNERMPSTLRLLYILEKVAEAGVPVTPTEINRELQLPKPTIHRLFSTLEEEGFLARDIDGRSYTPGRRLRRMSGGILASLRVRTARLAILRRLSGEIGETCNIAVPEREAMIYVERMETHWPLRIQLPIGSAVPFSCTASGKMYLATLPAAHLERYLAAADLAPRAPRTITDPARLLAEIERIRGNGHSTDDEEFMEGMVALAVPIRESGGRLVSTLSFHAPVQRFDIDRALAFLPQLHAAAARLSELLIADQPAAD